MVASVRQQIERPLQLSLRCRVETFKGSGEWDEVTLTKSLPAKETALIICDMWDKHWCQCATKRCDALAKKADAVVKALRKKGVTIIHAPSDCMAFYKDTPQRKNIQSLDKVNPPKARSITDAPLPIDDSDGGCDDDKPVKSFKAWTRQHSAIEIAKEDFISDNGQEVYNLLAKRGIKNLLVIGVHTHMCVLNRTFAIKQMTRWGVRCVLVRDLTDTMYNPKKRPFVTHDEGTELVVQHIEKYWCPSVLSKGGPLIRVKPQDLAAADAGDAAGAGDEQEAEGAHAPHDVRVGALPGAAAGRRDRVELEAAGHVVGEHTELLPRAVRGVVPGRNDVEGELPLQLGDGLLLGAAAADERVQGGEAEWQVGGDGVVLEVAVVRREQIELEVLRALVLDVLAVDHDPQVELPLRDGEPVLEEQSVPIVAAVDVEIPAEVTV